MITEQDPPLTPEESAEMAPLQASELTVSDLSRMFDLARGTVRKYLESEGVRPVSRSGNRTAYKFGDAVPAIVAAASYESPSDRRNFALAKKAEAETNILLQRYIRKDEIEAPTLAVYSRIAEVIEDSPIEEDSKDRIAARMRASLIELGINPETSGIPRVATKPAA